MRYYLLSRAVRRHFVLCLASLLVFCTSAAAMAGTEQPPVNTPAIYQNITSIKVKSTRITLTPQQRCVTNILSVLPSSATPEDLMVHSSNETIVTASLDEKGGYYVYLTAHNPGKAVVTLQGKSGKGRTKIAVTVKPLPKKSSLNIQREKSMSESHRYAPDINPNNLILVPDSYDMNFPKRTFPNDLLVSEEDDFAIRCIAHYVLVKLHPDYEFYMIDGDPNIKNPANAATIRTWLRAQYPNVVFGASNDLFTYKYALTYEVVPTYYFEKEAQAYGVWLGVQGIKQFDDTHFSVLLMTDYLTENRFIGDYLLLEKLPNHQWNLRVYFDVADF